MRVAVIGSGVAGLAATWLLNEHSPHDAHLYEADDRPGGHANTVHVTQPGKEPIDVDTGFIVFNPSTYPNFLCFLSMHVEVIKTQLTFSVSRDSGALEWAGDTLRSVFCQPRQVFNLGLWRMLFDIMRFNACAVRVLAENRDLSIGEYLQNEGYSSQFRDAYLIPVMAMLWSIPPDACTLDFPAKTLIRFMYSHQLLQITGKPSWRTIKGGSKTYIESILSRLPAAQLHLSTPIRAVWSDRRSTTLETATGERETFDHIIFACHSNDALQILDAGSGATPVEREALGAIHWCSNEVWLHSDESLMPRSRLAWSSWNYFTRTTVDEQGVRANDSQVSLSYWMNDLQHLPSQKHGNLFATINPLNPPSPATVLGRYAYTRPVLSAETLHAHRHFAQLNTQVAWLHRAFAGAWMRYGTHEDGFTSGMRAAAAVPGVVPPFPIANADALLRKPRVGAMVFLFDLLDVVQAFVNLLVGRVCLKSWQQKAK